MGNSGQISSRYFGLSGCYIFKSALVEYTQIKGLETPEYVTINEGPSHDPSFKSTVIVDNVKYDSIPGFPKRKASEQSAAEIALIKLAAKSEDSNEIIKSLLQESGLCKSLLFQYAQKMNYSLPCYVCQHNFMEEERCFTCAVTVGEMQFTGASARSKRAAEISAARAALLMLQTRKSDFEVDLDGNSQHTVIPCTQKPNKLTKTKFPVDLFDALKSLVAKEGVGQADEVRDSTVPVYEKYSARAVIPQDSTSIFQDGAASPNLSISSHCSINDLVSLPAGKLKLPGLEPKAPPVRGASNVGNISSGRNMDTKKIFVGGLPSALRDDDFRQYFETYGRVTDVAVMRDRSTQHPRGFGFVSFDTEDAVSRVMHKTFHDLNGKMVEVKRALPKAANPSSSGHTMCCGGCQGYRAFYDGRMESNRYGQPPLLAAGNYQAYGSPGYGAPPAFGYGGASNAGYGAYGIGAYGNSNDANVAYACGPPGAWRSPWATQAGYGGAADGSGGCQCAPTGQSPGYGNQGYGVCGERNGYYGNPGSCGVVRGCGGSTPHSNTAGAGYMGTGYDTNSGYPNERGRSDPRHGAGAGVGYGGYGR